MNKQDKNKIRTKKINLRTKNQKLIIIKRHNRLKRKIKIINLNRSKQI